MQAPAIKTAVPKRRYTIGSFTAVLLGDVESDDARRYRYIFAVVPDGDARPSLFVTCELERQNSLVRTIRAQGEQIVDVEISCRDIDAFADLAIRLVQTALGLLDQAPVRLM